MELKINVVKRERGVYHVVLFGPLDSDTCNDLAEKTNALLVQGTKAIVLDMGGVNYISSLGLGAIFNIAQGLKRVNGRLAITSLQPQIKKVFDTVKVLPQALFKDIAEADAYLNQLQRDIFEKDKPSSL